MRSRLFVSFAVLALAAPAALAAPSGAKQSLVVRTFDVAKIVAAHASDVSCFLGPRRPFQPPTGFDRSSDLQPKKLIAGDQLAQLIRTTIEPASWREKGSAVDYRQGGLLIVRSTPRVCAEVEALLKRLSLDAAQRVRLEVSLYELPADEYGAVAAGADPASITKERPKLLESGSVEMAPGVHRTLRVLNRVRFVADYEVQIAQAAEITDPVVVSRDEGLCVELCARPTLDHSEIELSAVTQSGKFRHPFRTVQLSTDEECFPRPYRSDRRYGNGRLQLPVYDEADSSVDALLHDNEALTIPVARDGKLFALRIVPTFTSRRAPRLFLDLAALTGGQGHRYAWFGFGRRPDFPTKARSAPTLQFTGRSSPPPGLGGADAIMDLVTQSVDPSAWNQTGTSISVSGTDQLLVTGPQELRSRVFAFLEEREAEYLRFLTLDLRVYSVAGPVHAGDGQNVQKDATLLFGAVLTTRDGVRTGVETGSRAAYLADYDVDVAQQARIADPTVGSAFDGLVANVTPTLSLDGKSLQVNLEMLLAHRGPLSEFDTGTQFLGPIEEFEVARRELNQTFDGAVNGSYVIDGGPDPFTPGHRLAVVVTNHLQGVR